MNNKGVLKKTRDSYRRGKRIDSLDELAGVLKTDRVLYCGKDALSSGFIQNWQFRLVSGKLRLGMFYRAVRISKEGRKEK